MGKARLAASLSWAAIAAVGELGSRAHSIISYAGTGQSHQVSFPFHVILGTAIASVAEMGSRRLISSALLEG